MKPTLKLSAQKIQAGSLSFISSSVLAALCVAISAPAVAQESAETTETAEESRAFGRGQVFADWENRFWNDETFNAFTLRRVELGGGWRWPDYGGFVANIEGLRSAQPESLLGVDGNSIVVRAKHAYAFGDPELGPGRLILQVGLIEDVWVATLESSFRLRGHAATTSERTGFFETSDLGATVGYDLLDELVTLQVSITNGEGRNEVELNRGKNSTVVLSTVPHKPTIFGDEVRPGVHVGYRDGSIGVGKARNHRIFGAATFDHPRAGLGVEFGRALGLVDDASLEAQALGIWVRGEPIERWLGAFFRWELLDQNLDSEDDNQQTFQAGAYTDLLRDGRDHIRIYLAGELGMRDANAPEVPGVPGATEYQAIRLTVDATSLFNFDSSTNEEGP